MSQTVRLFNEGGSQTLRLPTAFRFPSEEVFISRDDITGNVILSAKSLDWAEFFAAVKGLDVPEDFLSKEERTIVGNNCHCSA